MADQTKKWLCFLDFVHSERDYLFPFPSCNCSTQSYVWLAITPFFILKALKTEKSRNWLRSIVQHLFRLICVGHNENYFVTSNSVAPLKVDFSLFLSKNTFKQCSDIGKKENFLSHLAKLRVVLPVGRSQMLNDVRRRKWAVPNLAKHQDTAVSHFLDVTKF